MARARYLSPECSSRLSYLPTLPLGGYVVLFPEKSGLGVKMTALLYLVPKQRIRGVKPPQSLLSVVLNEAQGRHLYPTEMFLCCLVDLFCM